MNAPNIGTDGAAASATATQIAVLKADPNATAAYRQQLDQWQQAQAAAASPPGAPAQALAGPGPGPGAPPPAAAAPSAPAGTPALAAATPAPASSAGAPQSGADRIPDELKSFAPAIKDASAKTGVSQAELSAVIWQESRGQTSAATTNGGNGQTDAGLMQMNSSTFAELQGKHPELQGKSLNDPATNIMAGGYLLSDFKQQFGRDDLAERAYNSGPGSVDKSNANVTTTGLGDPNYIQKVSHLQNLIQSGQSLPA